MRQLAVRAIDLTPLVGQLEDRGDLLGPERVHRPPARPAILQPPGGLTRLPEARAPLRQPEHPARMSEAPPGARGLGEQPQKRRLDTGVDARRDRAYQPERVFPRNATNSIACSLTVSSKRAISARAAASSASSALARIPGLDCASALRAP